MEQMTLAMMMILAVIGGIIVVAVLEKQNKFRNRIELIISGILYCYFEYWILNVVRTLLLKGSIIYPYSRDYFLIMLDIVLVIAGIVFLYYWHEGMAPRYVWIRLVLCASVMIYHIGMISINYLKYNNVNAAVYNSLIHNNITFFGMILFLAYGLLHMFLESNTGKKIEKVEVSVIVLFIITVFVYPLMEIYITNANEFSFSIGQIAGWFAVFVLIVSVGGLGICTLTSGKVRKVYLLFLWDFSICSYVQGMYLNNKLFLMDGKAAEWSLWFKIGNIVIWCLLFSILFVCYKLFKNRRKEMVIFISVTLCIMQFVGLVSLLPGYVESDENDVKGQNYLSTQGLQEVAKDENIIIFVLDAYDVEYIEEVLEKKPDFLEPLRGFTYFPDNISLFSRTFPSIPYMLTGKSYFYEIPLNEYVEQSFQNCSLWNGLREHGFQFYFYEEDEGYIGSTLRKEAKNYVEEGHIIKEKTSFIGCVEAIVRMNGYRILPYALKENYFYTADIVNNLVIEEYILEHPEFMADDSDVYQELKEKGLQVAEEEKALRFIHLYGAHEPYVMDENGNRVQAGEGSGIAQYIGCMNLVYEYISMLQKLGVYENTTIIITADHGENFLSEQLEEATNPILFIKPYGAGQDEELVISDAYASQSDIIPTIAGMYGIEYTENDGIDLFSINENNTDRIRYHYYTVVEDTTQTRIREYEIRGGSLNFDNWYATDRYHEFGEYR